MTIPECLSSGEKARLIPVAADASREGRAVSVVLATLISVPPFARVMLASVGQRVGNRANLDCFTEICFKEGNADGKIRPDGLLILDGGRGRLWRCIVEAKIGKADLDNAQIAKYLVLAKNQKFDAVLTISNQFVAPPTHSPVTVPKNTGRGVELLHWSWMYLLTQAMLLLQDGAFDRPEQRYIIAEMVRYFSHPSVGVSSFDRMNSEWKDLVAQVQAGAKLNRSWPVVEKSVAAWHQEARDLCLSMTRKIGRPARLRLSRAHADDPIQRLRDDSADAVEKHELSCILEIPDAAAPLVVTASLLRRSVVVSMSLAAPRDKQRASSRINWLLRQLAKSAPEDLHIRAYWPGKAPATQATLASLKENPSLLEGENPNLSPTQFEVMLIRDLAAKFSGSKTFIEALEASVPTFYDQVGQRLRAYVPSPPRIRKDDAAQDAESSLEEVAEEAAMAAATAADESRMARRAEDE